MSKQGERETTKPQEHLSINTDVNGLKSLIKIPILANEYNCCFQEIYFTSNDTNSLRVEE